MSGDLEDFTCALAAADVVWSRELGDPPSEPAYIEALARNVWELWVEPRLEQITRELAEAREFVNDALTRSSERAREVSKWVEGFGKLSAETARLKRELASRPAIPADAVDSVAEALAEVRLQIGPNTRSLIADGHWKQMPLSLGERRTIAEVAVRAIQTSS